MTTAIKKINVLKFKRKFLIVKFFLEMENVKDVSNITIGILSVKNVSNTLELKIAKNIISMLLNFQSVFTVNKITFSV